MTTLWQRTLLVEIVCGYVMVACPIAATMIAYSWVCYQVRKSPQPEVSSIFDCLSHLNDWYVPESILVLSGIAAFLALFLAFRKREEAEVVARVVFCITGAIVMCYVSYAALALYSMSFYITGWRL